MQIFGNYKTIPKNVNLKIGSRVPQKLGPFLSLFLMRKTLSSGQKWFLRPYFPLIRGMFLLRSGLRFSFRALEVPQPRMRKRPLSLLIWPFPHSWFGHFQCPKRKSKTTFQQKHTPNQWEIWPQKPLLTTGKSFSHEEK